MTFVGLSSFPVRPVLSFTSLCSHNLLKLISSAKPFISHGASIGAWPRSKSPPRAKIDQAIRAILLPMAIEATRAGFLAEADA